MKADPRDVIEIEIADWRIVDEQKHLAKAVALADDVPELVTELQQRSSRIQNLEGQLIAAKRTPAELAALVDRVEANVRANVATLHHSLGNQGAETDRRKVFLAMFPHGLTFEPTRTPDGSRQIWLIRGDADFAAVTGQEPTGPVSFASRPPRAVVNHLHVVAQLMGIVNRRTCRPPGSSSHSALRRSTPSFGFTSTIFSLSTE